MVDILLRAESNKNLTISFGKYFLRISSKSIPHLSINFSIASSVAPASFKSPIVLQQTHYVNNVLENSEGT
jgi:hypothetical protein